MCKCGSFLCRYVGLVFVMFKDNNITSHDCSYSMLMIISFLFLHFSNESRVSDVTQGQSAF
jgi:hypothetical protein